MGTESCYLCLGTAGAKFPEEKNVARAMYIKSF
jgi:hypothetical protein